MYIPQYQLNHLEQIASPNKVTILYGPRRVGKTTLLKKYLANKPHCLLVSGDDLFVQKALSSQSIEQLRQYIGNQKILAIDEAQMIPNIGLNLKLCIDHIEGLTIIATGSSAFGLNEQVGEPLTGRKQVLNLFPLSQLELNQTEDAAQREANLVSRLIYGAYPEVILSDSDRNRKNYLLELVNAYLCKDLLEMEGIKKSKKIFDLLQLIALQLGKEVSCTEIGTQIGLNKKTVERYLDVLEQSFILIKLRGFNRNLRKEISKSPKYYFYDTGVRNALINNFNPLNARSDIGELWENYLVIERIKRQHYLESYAQNYFWRTYDQQEIDWVEDIDGHLSAYEFKWSAATARPPHAWTDAYPDASFCLVNQKNYLDFIT